MFKIGLELEEFCIDKKTEGVILVPKDSGIPHDGCGWLIEYRGDPCSDITDAVYSLYAKEHKARPTLDKFNVYGLRLPVMKPSKEVRLAARRRFIKSLSKYNNIYGHDSHRNSMAEAVAAVHISVTFSAEGKNNNRINKVWDFADFIRHMDVRFAAEIKDSKRNPGFYEIKSDGRVEYRSLPNNVDLNKLIEVVSAYKFKH